RRPERRTMSSQYHGLAVAAKPATRMARTGFPIRAFEPVGDVTPARALVGLLPGLPLAVLDDEDLHLDGHLGLSVGVERGAAEHALVVDLPDRLGQDRKSTRLNSSH